MDEQSIFLSALEKQTEHDQALWLDEACGSDAELRQRVEALLRRHHEANSFLEQPALAGLDITIDTNDNDPGLRNGSVLRSLGLTMAVPRISLREVDDGMEEPIARPKSPELPIQDPASRYQLLGEIARGGMGAILKGRDTDLGRDLAIKVLLESHRRQPEIIERFIEEAQIAGQLQHPGIAPVYELGQFADDRPFFTMKLVKGDTLSKLLSARKDPAGDRMRFLNIFEQICQTMAYAHSRGVIHRDLKPSNIMVGAFGEVQVMDWGLAKVLPTGGVADEKTSQQQIAQSIIQTRRSSGSDGTDRFGSVGSDTQMGSVMGTPAYMPPEQALGEIDLLDQRSDVFGLGAILCEILTGKPPYAAEDPNQVFRMATRGKLDECHERLNDCDADRELIGVVKKCLQPEPKDRFCDSSELAESINHYLESVESKLRKTELKRAEESARAGEEKKRRRITTALTALIILVIATVAIFWTFQRQAAIARIYSTLNDARDYERIADQIDLANPESLKSKKNQLQLAQDRAKSAVRDSKFDRNLHRIAISTQVDLAEKLNRAEQEISVLAFIGELERIRDDPIGFDDVELAEADVNWSATSSKYDEVFRKNEFDLRSMSSKEAIAKLKDYSIEDRKPIIQALDSWAHTLLRQVDVVADAAGESMGNAKEISVTKLLQIADAIDKNQARIKLRRFLVNDDSLSELAKDNNFLRKLPAAGFELLGRQLKAQQESALARDVIRTGLVKYPNDFWLNLSMAVFSENFKDGVEYARACLALRPQSTVALLNLQARLVTTNRQAEALAICENAMQEELEKKEPSLAELRWGVLVLVSTGKDEQANQIASELVEKYKHGNSRQRMLSKLIQGESFGITDDYDRAEDVLQSIEIGGETVETKEILFVKYRRKTILADCCMLRGKPELAIEHLRAAIDLFGESKRFGENRRAEIHAQIATILLNQGKLEEALNEADSAIADGRCITQLQLIRLQYYALKKDSEKANKVFNELYERAREQEEMGYWRLPAVKAWALAACPKLTNINSKEIEELLEAAKRVADRFVEFSGRENFSMLNTVGVIAYRKGQWDEAIDYLSRSETVYAKTPVALKMYDDHLYNLLFLAMAHHQRGDEDVAKRYYKDAREVHREKLMWFKHPFLIEFLREAEEMFENRE